MHVLVGVEHKVPPEKVSDLPPLYTHPRSLSGEVCAFPEEGAVSWKPISGQAGMQLLFLPLSNRPCLWACPHSRSKGARRASLTSAFRFLGTSMLTVTYWSPFTALLQAGDALAPKPEGGADLVPAGGCT